VTDPYVHKTKRSRKLLVTQKTTFETCTSNRQDSNIGVWNIKKRNTKNDKSQQLGHN